MEAALEHTITRAYRVVPPVHEFQMLERYMDCHYVTLNMYNYARLVYVEQCCITDNNSLKVRIVFLLETLKNLANVSQYTLCQRSMG